MNLFIGVMSGTSLDGIDVAVTEFTSTGSFRLHAAETFAYDPKLRQALLNLIESQQCSLSELGQLDMALGQAYSKAVNTLLDQQQLARHQIKAIGCHGQTICHAPDLELPFSLQIGNPSLIAEKTGITTVSDFRERDMVAGGQGAPLVPAFHQSLFSSDTENRVILNIGGISNITVLSTDKNSLPVAFDTGPGNVLMDAWTQQSRGLAYDAAGEWAASGQSNPELLNCLLAEPYFARPAPKSTGRELFNSRWLSTILEKCMGKETLAPADIQATLLDLTCVTIANDIQRYAPQTQAVYICGGGAHNTHLLNSLQQRLGSSVRVATTEPLGLSPDWIEACAFAWLAQQTLLQRPGNLPSATGARNACILGGIYASSNAS